MNNKVINMEPGDAALHLQNLYKGGALRVARARLKCARRAATKEKYRSIIEHLMESPKVSSGVSSVDDKVQLPELTQLPRESDKAFKKRRKRARVEALRKRAERVTPQTETPQVESLAFSTDELCLFTRRCEPGAQWVPWTGLKDPETMGRMVKLVAAQHRPGVEYGVGKRGYEVPTTIEKCTFDPDSKEFHCE